MKKKILLLGILFISIFCLTGCGDKNPITKETFKTEMEKKGYTISDSTEQFADYSHIKGVYIASKSGYHIEFYEIEDVDKAKGVYETNKEEIENQNSVKKSSVEINLGNHQKYEVTANNNYNVVIRVDKTMIYVQTNKKYKKEIIDVLKELDYY